MHKLDLDLVCTLRHALTVLRLACNAVLTQRLAAGVNNLQ
jgi:hypothetical protein